MHTIISFDAKAMYPSVKFLQIEKAVDHFLRDAPQRDKELVTKCLDMVKFGMANTIVHFQGQYWEYGGAVDVYEKGLTIGGFESTFFCRLGGSLHPGEVARTHAKLILRWHLPRRWTNRFQQQEKYQRDLQLA